MCLHNTQMPVSKYAGMHIMRHLLPAKECRTGEHMNNIHAASSEYYT